jgi:RNA polymerase sigma factor (sigma-70 family)
VEDSISLNVQSCLDRLRRGEAVARTELLQLTWKRLRAIATSKMRGLVRCDGQGDSSDLFQETQVRLWQTLQVMTPESPRHYLNIASQIMRQELIDLLRRAKVRQHQALAPAESGSSDPGDGLASPGTLTDEPGRVALWTEFHERAEQLPPEAKEVFSLCWYQGLSKEDAAALMGVSVRTVYRYWTEACDRLGELLE